MHLRRALALSLAVPLLLAGCTEEEPTPKIPDPTTSSATPTPEETETAEPESAEEFIRRWADVMREMQETGRTDAFRALGPDCSSCSKAASRVEQIYEGGGQIQWRGWTIINVRPYGDASNQFRVRVRSAPTRIRESAGGEWQTLDGGPSTRLLELEETDDGWLVTRTAELAS